jgi:hypothetical protein
MLWCVSVAAFGEPVVPEVNWMLIVRLQHHSQLNPKHATKPVDRLLSNQSFDVDDILVRWVRCQPG